MTEQVSHISRPPLPWRDPALLDTECVEIEAHTE